MIIMIIIKRLVIEIIKELLLLVLFDYILQRFIFFSNKLCDIDISFFGNSQPYFTFVFFMFITLNLNNFESFSFLCLSLTQVLVSLDHIFEFFDLLRRIHFLVFSDIAPQVFFTHRVCWNRHCLVH